MSCNDDITDTDRIDWLQSILFSDIDIGTRIDTQIKRSNFTSVPDTEIAHLVKGSA